MIITLAWGWKYGLLAATLGMGCQTMWFLWLRTSGWGSVISVPFFTLWVIWHGWCADQHKKKETLWSKLYLAEVPFRLLNTIILYTAFRFMFQFNPPPWAPEVTNTVVPLEYVNFIVVKEIINANLVLIVCDVILNLDKVRTFFKLEKKSEYVKTNYISSVSIIIGVLFWITDGFLSYLIFESGGGSIIDLIILNVPIHNLFTRIVFLASCLVVGLVLSNFFNKEQESQIIIQEQEKRFKDVAENILEWIWETDANGKYTYSSPVVKVLLGYKHQEVLNKYFYDFFPPKDREQLKKITFDILAKKKTYFKFTRKYERNNGKTVWLSTRGIAILDEKGELLGFKGTSIDITARKKAEEKLIESMENLLQSNEELKQFTYVASHDLQEPLRMIVSFIQLIEKRYKDKLDEDANSFIAFIVDGAKRMQTMINDLLIYSRIGRKDTQLSQLDINIVIKVVIDNLRKSIEETNAKITYDPLPIIIANETGFMQLLQNLISNAIKFHKEEEPPVVHISANLQKNQWIFSIRDNGIGIDSQFFERIFIVFQRLHKKDEYGGTGIGLAICKKIVQNHKGNIWVESEVGKGSTFYFSFPNK